MEVTGSFDIATHDGNVTLQLAAEGGANFSGLLTPLYDSGEDRKSFAGMTLVLLWIAHRQRSQVSNYFLQARLSLPVW